MDLIKLNIVILEFDLKDSICNLFIESYCKILCRIFGITNIDLNEKMTEKDIKFYSEQEEINSEDLLNKCKNFNKNNFNIKKIKSEVFNVDDFNNSHLDFIYSCSALRARNHNICDEDRNKTLLIAGKIITSIPSINPILAGALSLQLIILSYTKNLNYLHKGIFDLGNNIFTLLSLSSPKIIEDEAKNIYLNKPIIAIPKGFTRWTKIVIKGSKTCKGFIDCIKEIYNVDINAIFVDNILLYHKINTKNEKKIKEMNEILKNSIESIYFQKIKKLNLIKNNIFNKLFLSINGKIDKNYVKMPLFQYEY